MTRKKVKIVTGTGAIPKYLTPRLPLTRTYYHKYRLFTIRAIINRWAPPQENLTATYIENVCRLTGIAPDEPIGIPSDRPQRWMMVGVAMAIQECGKESLDYFAMLRGWGMSR